MFGKIFDSLFTGSMRGAGADVIAVWAYVISHTQEDSHLEMNAEDIAPRIGMTVEDALKAIEFLCAPDSNSRSKSEGGARLVREGQFLYRVVNHGEYRNIRDKDDRREYMKIYMRGYRKPEVCNTKVHTKVHTNDDTKCHTQSGICISDVVVKDDGDVGEEGVHQSERQTAIEKALEIYDAYPRKVGKPAAVRAIIRAMKSHPCGKILAVTRIYAEARRGEDAAFTPHPATWFNQERFNDAPETWRSSSQQGKPQTPKEILNVES